MILKWLKRTLSIGLALLTVSCSYVKGSFPDKTKDYQLTEEIPPLKVPDNLSANQVQHYTPVVSPVSETPEIKAYEENSGNLQSIPDSTEVDLFHFNDQQSIIRIYDTLMRGWRIVGKALSHNSIEITNRDVLEGTYYVQYDPNFEQVEDGSLWDEVLFIFGSDPAQEQEYLVKLKKQPSYSDVTVEIGQSDEDKVDASASLLKLIYDTIKKDLSE